MKIGGFKVKVQVLSPTEIDMVSLLFIYAHWGFQGEGAGSEPHRNRHGFVALYPRACIDRKRRDVAGHDHQSFAVALALHSDFSQPPAGENALDFDPLRRMSV